jgi:tetratricopeptide (TPR) repeat protein
MAERTVARRLSAAALAAALIATGGGVGSAVHAQAADRVAEAKVLYANASYAEALRALTEEKGEEAYQYRALSLLALGRATEAQQTLDALVTSTPGYAVAAEDMPPRFIALLTQTKQRLLPTVLRRLLASGREQFQANAFEAAKKDFELLLKLASDPMIRDLADVADLRLLASGFIDVMASKMPPAPAPEPSPSRPLPAPAAKAAPTAVVTPAVAISQRVPPWPTTAGAPALAASALGVVRLRIGADGRVKSAVLERGVHPVYNVELLAAARLWQYKPATIDGVPIESETVVSFRVER